MVKTPKPPTLGPEADKPNMQKYTARAANKRSKPRIKQRKKPCLQTHVSPTTMDPGPLHQTEEAYVNYLESRRRMRDLALSRGFYPIVALGPEVGQQAYGRKGDGKGKGKGKSKGGKSKGKGKSKSFTRTFQNRRPMSGLRRSNGTTSTSASSTTSTSSGSELRSTLSGSTAQHGPRFKRYRMQSSGVKEVPEEQIAMVAEEVICESNYAMDERFFQESAVGQAIVDSGASRTIVGEDVWTIVGLVRLDNEDEIYKLKRRVSHERLQVWRWWCGSITL